jgi:hypothetical protein
MADNLDPETLRQLNDSMRDMRETVAGMVPAMVLMTAAMNENMNATKGNSNSTKNSKKIVDDFLKSQQEATAATESRAKSDEEMAKVQANRKIAEGQAIEGLKKLGNGLLTAGGDMTKYGGAVSSAGDAAMSITKNFGILGLAVGGLIKLFTMGAEMVLKQNAAMLKSADILADFGATGALTTTELLSMANAAGYSSGEMEKFAGITKGLGTDIIGLSATVTGGVKAFAELATMDETLLANYRAMGVTQEQLNKNQADYIKLQIKSGMAISERDKQDGTLKRTTLEYTNYLMDLSAITGLSVDEAKKAQEVARADLAVQTRLALLQDKEEKLRSRGLAEGNKEMIAQADSIKGERERTAALVDFAGTFMKGEELAGVQSMIATGNFNELSASFASGAPEILEFINAVKKGDKQVYDFDLMMAQATKRTRENLGEAVIQNKEVGKSFAYSLDALKNEAKFRGKSPEVIAEMREEERKAREKALKEGTTDPAKAARNAQEQAERRARLGADAIVGLLNGPVTGAFEKLMKVMSGVMKGMAIYSDKLFGTDLAKMFESSDDIAEKQQKNALALNQTVNEIEKAKAAISDPAKYKQSLEDQRKLADEEVKTKMNLFRDLKKQANEEKDVAKKAILEKKVEEASKEVGEANRKKLQADIDAQNARNRTDDRIKKEAQEKLLALEKKKIELTTEENKLDEDHIRKQLEEGKITVQQAAVMRRNSSRAVQQQDQRDITSRSASSAESAGTQSSAESKRLGMTSGSGSGSSDASYLKKVAQVESAGKANAKADTSSAAGLFQFTEGTWKQMTKQMGLNYSLEDRFDPKKAEEVASYFTKQQRRQLEKGTGKDASDADMYMAHFLGAGGATKFLNAMQKDPNAPASEGADDKALQANRSIFYNKEGQIRTLQEVYNLMSNKINKAGELIASGKVSDNIKNIGESPQSATSNVASNTATPMDKLPQAAEGGIFSGPNTGYPVAMHGNELVAPLDPNSIIAKMLTSTPDQIMQMANQNTATTNSTPENNGLTLEVFTMLAEKLDTMITMLSTSNDTQEQLLKYSRV